MTILKHVFSCLKSCLTSVDFCSYKGTVCSNKRHTFSSIENNTINPLNMDTPLMPTLSVAPSVSV